MTSTRVGRDDRGRRIARDAQGNRIEPGAGKAELAKAERGRAEPGHSEPHEPKRVEAEPRAERGQREQLDPDRLAALEEERDFLLRSIDDLEREHEAGDIDDQDYHQLSDGYVARTAEVLRAIEERREAFVDAKRTTSIRRKALTVIGVLVFGLVAGILVAHFSGQRQSGQEITGTGTIKNTTTQDANACLTDTSSGQMSKAVTCFRKVLDADPTNPTALTYLGWTLVLSSGSLPGNTGAEAITAGQNLVDKAIKSDPAFPDAWAFKAIIADQLGHPQVARQALDTLNTLNPPAEITQLVAGLSAKIDKELKAGPTTTTRPGSTPTSVAGSVPTTTPTTLATTATTKP